MFVSLDSRKYLVMESIMPLLAIECKSLLIPLVRGSVGSESISV